MTRCILYVSILALAAAATPAHAVAQTAKDKSLLPKPSSPLGVAKDDCTTRIRKLDASQAEGEQRLREKYLVIDYCVSQYENDKTIERLVNECAKYEEQPVVKRQFVAECQLAAFSYANALRALKAEFGK